MSHQTKFILGAIVVVSLVAVATQLPLQWAICLAVANFMIGLWTGHHFVKWSNE